MSHWTFALPYPSSLDEMISVGKRMEYFRRTVLRISKKAFAQEVGVDYHTVWQTPSY